MAKDSKIQSIEGDFFLFGEVALTDFFRHLDLVVFVSTSSLNLGKQYILCVW